MADNERNPWIFSPDMLNKTPSREDGISWDKEKRYRQHTVLFILELGVTMRSHKTTPPAEAVADSAACIMFHRFFVYQSFKTHNRYIIGAACLFLAMKVEECPRKLDTLLKGYCQIKLYDQTDEIMTDLREKILVAERILLHTLSFDLKLEHPIAPCVMKVKIDLKSYVPDNKKVELVNVALHFLRDSCRTVLCLLYPASKIALGAVFLATLQLGINPVIPRRGSHALSSPRDSQSLSNVGKSWYELIKDDIDVDTLKDICYHVIEIYERNDWVLTNKHKYKPPNIVQVKSCVDDLGRSGESGERHPGRSSTGEHNEPSNSSRDMEEVNLDDPYPYDEEGSNIASTRRVQVTNVKPRSVDLPAEGGATSAPAGTSVPPTPEFLPPPPTPPTATGARAEQPPTPDFLPPPDTPPVSLLESANKKNYSGMSGDGWSSDYGSRDAQLHKQQSSADMVSPKRARLQ